MLASPEPYGSGLAPSYFLAPKSNQKVLGGFKCEATIKFYYYAGGNQPPRPLMLDMNLVLKKTICNF